MLTWTQRPALFALSIRARLGLIQLSLLFALLAVSLVAWHASESERGAGHLLAVLSRAERNHAEADLLHEALLADVEQALRVDSPNDEAEVLGSAKAHVRALENYLAALRDPQLPPEATDRIRALVPRSSRQGAAAAALIDIALRDRGQALAREPAFRAASMELDRQSEEMTQFLKAQVESAERHSFTDASRSEVWIIATCAGTAVFAWGFVALISGSVRQSLRKVCDAARALATGNLSARSHIESEDEVGELALSLNKMADDLQGMVDRLLAEAHRDAFGARVSRALDMAESEADVKEIASRALAQIGEQLASEILLSAPGKDTLRRVAVNPSAGGPGCGVDALGSCAAIRRAGAITFESSEALDACPRLRARPQGPLSATCVPVSFMGKAFGVLHAAAGDKKPPSSPQQAQLMTLGTQMGARIGTLRTLENTRAHAYTDTLTGLSNRRSMEHAREELAQAGSCYALAMADLDHFKRLNDVHGHEAGDRALRLFAEVLRASIRQADKAARWGGEEFAILFPDSTAEQVYEVVERVRLKLAETLAGSGHLPFTVSFGLADSTMGTCFEDVLRIADQALYHSKDNGRNRTTIASKNSFANTGDEAGSSVLDLLETGAGAVVGRR